MNKHLSWRFNNILNQILNMPKKTHNHFGPQKQAKIAKMYLKKPLYQISEKRTKLPSPPPFQIESDFVIYMANTQTTSLHICNSSLLKKRHSYVNWILCFTQRTWFQKYRYKERPYTCISIYLYVYINGYIFDIDIDIEVRYRFDVITLPIEHFWTVYRI